MRQEAQLQLPIVGHHESIPLLRSERRLTNEIGNPTADTATKIYQEGITKTSAGDQRDGCVSALYIVKINKNTLSPSLRSELRLTNDTGNPTHDTA